MRIAGRRARRRHNGCLFNNTDCHAEELCEDEVTCIPRNPESVANVKLVNCPRRKSSIANNVTHGRLEGFVMTKASNQIFPGEMSSDANVAYL